jgi:hypothetical protein
MMMTCAIISGASRPRWRRGRPSWSHGTNQQDGTIHDYNPDHGYDDDLDDDHDHHPCHHQRRKSTEMATREAELEARGYQVWVEARKEANYDKFLPLLRDIVALKVRKHPVKPQKSPLGK